MLGERGLWYKMTFFEAGLPHSADRACAEALRGASGERLRYRRSILLPTLAELAHDGATPDTWPEIDGRSLLPHLQGDRRP